MNRPGQVPHKPRILAQANRLDQSAAEMVRSIRQYERAFYKVKLRLGRTHITCKKCGKVFDLKDAPLRIPPFGVDEPTRAQCPRCHEEH